MKKIPLSFLTACLIGTTAFAGKIVGVDASNKVVEESTQYGFGGWNLDNVLVKIVSIDDFTTALPGTSFDEATGMYSPMTYGMSFESEISTENELRALLHGKNWPVGEPSGIKIVNNDMKVNNGKPENCIINTSYLAADDNPPTYESGYLNAETPAPTICSSAFQTHKRFKINMLPSTVAVLDGERYGKPIDVVFNLESGDTSTARYEVFSKINNYTGMRLDGYKIEVLDANGNHNDNLTLSLGIGENDGADIWAWNAMATFSSGLWGPADGEHFLTDGFFDSKNAGFTVTGHGTSTIVGGPTTLGSNYVDLFGMWLPSKWQPLAIYFDFDNDPTTDADIVAFWGTTPDEPTAAPNWHKGQADGWAVPTEEELLKWTTDPLYSFDYIEDTLNLGLNYIITIGDNTQLGDTITVRITPRVATVQTPPSYIDTDGNYILPQEVYTQSEGVVSISPSPTFVIGGSLSLGVADVDPNTDEATQQTVTVTVTTDTGDSESIVLTETDVNSSIFGGTLPTVYSTDAPVANDGVLYVMDGSEVTVTYDDGEFGFKTAETKAVAEVVDDTNTTEELVPTSGGGGCTYNPTNGKFDLMFFMMMGLGAFYLIRKRTAR